MESADDASCRYKRLGCEIQFRDQLLIAFLTSRPIRLKNLATLELGRHIVQVDGIFWLRLHADVTKNRKHIEATLTKGLTPYRETYLSPHFPSKLDFRCSDVEILL